MKSFFKFILILLSCVMVLSSCISSEITDGNVLSFEAENESEFLYFYGVVKKGGEYYVRVLTEYMENPSEEDYRYALLSDKLNASFQPDGLVGAWNPTDYFSAKELYKAAKKGEITEASKFKYTIENGYINSLTEENYYADNNVTGG